MKKLLFILVSSMTFFSCGQKDYFKFTYTDELNPIGILPEHYEISSNGKLVVLTNRFNENDEIYNRSYFIELTKQQLDTAFNIIQNIKNITPISQYNDSVRYTCRFDKYIGNNRISSLILAGENVSAITNLSEFISQKLITNKRYEIDHSYYFNTSEFCIGAIE